jgi:pimeloyl-ACP methyl ester carboxylesterase
MLNAARHLTRVSLLALALTGIALAQAAAPETKQVEVFGQKIVYVEAGSPANPTVILLHGLGGDSSNWAMTTPALAAKYHLVVPDQIGFGKSDKPIANYRVAMLVEFLDKFCQKLGIQKASLVGNSLGGWTAAAFALAHPDKVDKLVLVDAAGYSSKRWGGPELTREALNGLNPSTTAQMKATFSLIFANKAMLTDPMIETMYAAKLKRGDGATINSFIESVLRGEDFLDDKAKAIKAPTLVLWGRQDLLTPLAIGEAFAKDIAGAQLVVLENCGHVPQMEKAMDFNAAVLKFLAGAQTAQTK